MWKTLHYKNERAMPFATFISKAQKMLNIYYKNEEPKTMGAQVRWLLDQIQEPSLQATVAGLTIDVEKDPEYKIWDFNKCANHIASQIRKSSPGDTKNVSSVNSKKGRHGNMKDGEIFTGTYTMDEWRSLSKDEQSAVINARGSKKQSGGGNGKGPTQKNLKKVKALTKRVKKQQKQIASLRKRAPASDSEDDDSSGEEPTTNDAGNAFGGRAGKQNKKKQQKKE